MSRSVNELKALCQEHGYDSLQFWPMSWIKDYAVSLRMKDADTWEEFDVNVVFTRGEHRKDDSKFLERVVGEFQEPVLLVVPFTDGIDLKPLYQVHGLELIPVRWTDKNEKEYQIYLKGSINMGSYVNLMEHVEEIGNDIVAFKRHPIKIMFSFFSLQVVQILRYINMRSHVRT